MLLYESILVFFLYFLRVNKFSLIATENIGEYQQLNINKKRSDKNDQ